MVGRLLSFWDGIFSVAMLNFQGVGGGLVLFLFQFHPDAWGNGSNLRMFFQCVLKPPTIV